MCTPQTYTTVTVNYTLLELGRYMKQKLMKLKRGIQFYNNSWRLQQPILNTG